MIGRCVGVNEAVPVVILAGVILTKQLQGVRFSMPDHRLTLPGISSPILGKVETIE